MSKKADKGYNSMFKLLCNHCNTMLASDVFL